MQNTNKVSNRFIKTSTGLLSRVFKQKRDTTPDSNDKPDTILETAHRRHERWTNIREQRKSAWDANTIIGKMGRVLRPTNREEEAGGISERERRASERNIKLARLYENEDFKEYFEILKNFEANDYLSLTTPEYRKKGMSLQYYIGFINGRISRGEDEKNLIITAIAKIKHGQLPKE